MNPPPRDPFPNPNHALEGTVTPSGNTKGEPSTRGKLDRTSMAGTRRGMVFGAGLGVILTASYRVLAVESCETLVNNRPNFSTRS